MLEGAGPTIMINKIWNNLCFSIILTFIAVIPVFLAGLH